MNSTQILGFLSRSVGPSSLWQIATQGLARGRDVAGYTKSVLLGSWDTLKKDNLRDDTVRLIKLACGGGLGLWSGATAFRNYEEGRAVTTLNGNINGSVVWSWSQAAMHAVSTGLTVGGMLMPNGRMGWIMRNIPAMAVVPALGALAMDHFQSLCTCTLSHPLAKMAQFGLSNYMVDIKTAENPGAAFRSTLLPWWSRNIRTLDAKAFKLIGVDFKNPNTFMLNESNPVTVA